jgi:hypothetical protein
VFTVFSVLIDSSWIVQGGFLRNDFVSASDSLGLEELDLADIPPAIVD